MLKFYQILSFLVFKVILVSTKSDNKPPYFLSSGDFSSFSIPENFQVGTSVYKLKGNLIALKSISSTKLIDDLTKKIIMKRIMTKKSHIH